MKDEKTVYDDELVNAQNQQKETTNEKSTVKTENQSKDVPNRKPLWKKTAAGAGMGFVAGAAATLLTSAGVGDGHVESQQHEDSQQWVDAEVPVANGIRDDMSFAEAFHAARTEVGPGGVFEWHGGVYGTYYESEWEAMSPEEQAEFNGHFSWNNYHTDDAIGPNEVNAVADTETTGEEMEVVPEIDTVAEGSYQVSDNSTVIAEVDNEGPNVEVLGVEYNEEVGGAVGGLMIDGHEAVVVDVNGDMNFDILGVDLNDDQQLEESELADISDAGLSVDDLGGYTQNDVTLSEGSSTDEVIEAEV